MGRDLKLGSLFSGKEKSVVGIDVGSSSIKIVELKEERGKIVLATYGEVATGPAFEAPIGSPNLFDPDPLAEILRNVLTEANVETRRAGVALQSSASLMFTLSLPASAMKSLDGVIPLEARQYIPVPLSEVVLNWSVVPDHIQHRYEGEEMTAEMTENAEREVLIAATRNDVLGNYTNLMGQAELKVGHYELEIFSALRSTLDRELVPLILIDLGAQQTRVAVVHYGVVMQFRTINRGGWYITQNLARSLGVSLQKAEELKRSVGLIGDVPDVVQGVELAMMQIIQDIKNTIQEFQSKYRVVVDRGYLIGGVARTLGLSELMNRELGIDIYTSDPFAKVENPEFLDPVLGSIGPEFAVAAGVALHEFLG